jgi:spore coat polysaccharide biosynthesis protein SpsF
MGSSRLPGKVMLPLDGMHIIEHDIVRVTCANTVDNVLVATTEKTRDDIIVRYAERCGAAVFRGSEEDVLDRMYKSAESTSANTIVRITSDCPLIDPMTIDTVVNRLSETDADYASNILERTFPRGLDVEAFTLDSFRRVADKAKKPHHREHVTPFYREQPNMFNLKNVTADKVPNSEAFAGRTDLRLTLDEADDYELLRIVYKEVEYDDILDVRDAIRYIDEYNLHSVNNHISQKTIHDDLSDSS